MPRFGYRHNVPFRQCRCCDKVAEVTRWRWLGRHIQNRDNILGDSIPCRSVGISCGGQERRMCSRIFGIPHGECLSYIRGRRGIRRFIADMSWQLHRYSQPFRLYRLCCQMAAQLRRWFNMEQYLPCGHIIFGDTTFHRHMAVQGCCPVQSMLGGLQPCKEHRGFPNNGSRLCHRRNYSDLYRKRNGHTHTFRPYR